MKCFGIYVVISSAGAAVTVPFIPGRMDATQEQAGASAMAVLEPVADGFRNYQKA